MPATRLRAQPSEKQCFIHSIYRAHASGAAQIAVDDDQVFGRDSSYGCVSMMKADAGQWRSRPPDMPSPIWRRAVFGAAAGSLLLLTCCATPIQVERVEPRVVEQELDSNALSTGRLSELTRII